jgi:hypothetical protein
VEIGIEQTDLSSLCCEGGGEGGTHGAFADSAFTGKDKDAAFDVVKCGRFFFASGAA